MSSNLTKIYIYVIIVRTNTAYLKLNNGGYKE